MHVLDMFLHCRRLLHLVLLEISHLVRVEVVIVLGKEVLLVPRLGYVVVDPSKAKSKG